MGEPLLEVRALKKHFPIFGGVFRHQVGAVKAVDGIDFTVHEGEVLGMVGESGSGKSTAGRAAIRLIEPSAGKTIYRGKELQSLNRSEARLIRQEIQMIFQDPYASLNPRCTVGESIGEPLLYHGRVKTVEERDQQVAEILKQVGLSSDAMHRYPHEFSGGQQQRICIGRAIALKPKLLICDEAVSALDISIQAQILNLLHELKTTLGLSYLFISHDLSVIRHISDRIVVLYLGKVMEVGTTEEIFANPKHPYTQALLSAVPKEHPKEQKRRILLQGEMPSPLHPPKGCPFHTRCPVAQAVCSQGLPPAKDLSSSHRYHCIH